MAVSCNYCDKLLSSQTNPNRHKRNVHNLEPRAVITYNKFRSKWSHKCLEENCDASFRKNDDLLIHIKDDHGFAIDFVIKEFDNWKVFKVWKSEIESTEQCFYRFCRRYKVNSEEEKTIYMCNRSGKQPNLAGNKRVIKSQGSCKINSSCISRLIAIQKGDKVTVTQIKTHYGHKMELKHLRISTQDRNHIASKLSMGFSKKNVLDHVRDHIGTENMVKRVDLLTRQDVVNIGKSFNLEDTNSTAKREILKRHKCSLAFKIENIINDCNWILKSNGDEYLIQKNSAVDKCCALICQECDICIHAYTCNCTDFLINSTICIHIHYIAKEQSSNNITKMPATLDLAEEHSSNNKTKVPATSEPLLPGEEKGVLNTLNPNFNTDTFTSDKEKIASDLTIITTYLFTNLTNSFLEHLDNENLTHIGTKLTELEEYVQPLLTNKFKSVLQSPNLSNQRIEKQVPFLSTKKKTTKADSLKKTDYLEKQKIQPFLSEQLSDHDYF